MNSLRARIALILIVSIFCVVALSTLVISYVMSEIAKRNFGEGFVDRVMMIAPALKLDDQLAQLRLTPEPGPGRVLEDPRRVRNEGAPCDNRSRSAADLLVFLEERPERRI